VAVQNSCLEFETCTYPNEQIVCTCEYPHVDDGACRQITVLVLDDVDEVDGNVSVLDALRGAGFDVIQGPLYYNWDGASPSLTGVDTILSLEGYNYGYEYTDGAYAAIAAFVAAGGGFIRTEWGLEEDYIDFGTPLMPVAYDDDYNYGSTWTTIDVPGHPLARDVVVPFVSEAAACDVSLIGAGVAVITNDTGQPIVSYTTEHGGTTVHLNHDTIYTTDPIEDEALQLYINAVYFSGMP